MWYAITYLKHDSKYGSVLAFVRSVTRGAIPRRALALATPKKTREVVRAWDVMKLHGNACRDYIEPYTGRWMTEEEFKRIIQHIVEKCYKDPKTRRRKLEMFEKWLNSEPRFGNAQPQFRYDIIKIDKKERISLVGNECIQAYKMPYDEWLYRYRIGLGIHEYRKSYILAIDSSDDRLNIYFVVINKECLEKDNIEIPHIPSYGIKVIREVFQKLPKWMKHQDLYFHLLPKDPDPRLVKLLERIINSYKQANPDQETADLQFTLARLYLEYTGMIIDMRHNMHLKPAVLPKPVDDAIVDVLMSKTIETTNPEDFKKKLKKYIEIVNKAIEVNKERMVESALLS